MGRKQQWTQYQGTRRQNMDGYWYRVGERTGDYRYGKPLYRVIFESGFETVATSQDLWRNQLKDWGSASVCGVGITGWEITNPAAHPLYGTWHGMIERCYSGAERYRNYHGVTVCGRWHHLPSFVVDAPNLPGYDLDRIGRGQLTIDKDKIGMEVGRREYGPETCCWLTVAEQNVYKRPQRDSKAPQSGFRGVTFLNDYWLARVQIDRKKTSLGCFERPLDAACAVLKRFPEYYMPEEKARIQCALRRRRVKENISIGLLGREGWFSLASLERGDAVA